MKLIMAFLFIIFTLTFQANAQVSCLDSTGCTVVVANKTSTFTLIAPSCGVTVTYDVLDCGGVKSINIKSYTVDGSCTEMTEFSIYHYSLSALNEYISLALIEIEAGTIPTCPSTTSIIKVYTASCGIWVGCEYEVDPASRVCDMGYLAPYPDYGSSPTKVKVYKWQSCGEVCCENTYSLCRKTSAITSATITTMTKISSLPAGECSLQSNYATTCQKGCM